MTLAEKWADGAASLYGVMTRGFPNLFLMPAPTQQAVVTVNYTQLAVAGAEFVTGAISLLRKQGVEAFDVSAQAEEAWTQKIVRLLHGRHLGHGRLHAVAHQQRRPPRDHQPAQRQLRRRVRRLVRLPRPPRELGGRRPLRGTRARSPLEHLVSTRQRVAVVTGGGGGIGGAIAEDLGRSGWFVVTVDPLVTLDGTEQLAQTEETTAGRIVAAGGTARASSASVTDGEALRTLFCELADERGGLDAVVNVAGITRQSYYARGTEEDWLALLEVHLGGYLNVLEAALPLMAAAGHGRILGITSGSGWRAADAGGYSAAKRVVASLTWQLGRLAPPGVTVNAISPIANTRMVQAAFERAQREGRTGGGGGLTLNSMPGPEDIGPLGAHVVSDGFGWCSGQVLFAGGPEVAVVDQPRLIEVVRTAGAASLAGVLDTVVPRAFVAAETKQASDGGSNPRFAGIFDDGDTAPSTTPAPVQSCAIVSDRPELAAALTAALESRGIACHRAETAHGFDGTAKSLQTAVDSAGPLDAVVVALEGHPRTSSALEGWEHVLADHRGLLEPLHDDASWSRAVADYAGAAERPVRLMVLTDATTPAGRSRAQASAQLARVAAAGTKNRVTALTAGLEASGPAAGQAAGELAAHLLAHPDSAPLAGAELVVNDQWLGLRSHPRPIGTVTYGGPAIPDWLDDSLREIVGATGPLASRET